MLNSLDRYIARLILVPLVSTLVIAAMLLLLDQMLRLFDFVINQGGPVDVVWRMLANTIPEYISLGIPIGLMLGVILAFRKLAANSELDAILATGQSYWRLLRVPMLFALVLLVINTAILGFLAPLTRYAYEGLRFELRTGALGASIKVGEFAKFGKDLTLRVEEAKGDGQDLRGIFASTTNRSGTSITAAAESGRFLATDDPDIILFRLSRGALVMSNAQWPSPRLLDFSVHDIPISLPQIEKFRARSKELELTLPELFANAANRSIAPAVRRKEEANLQRRLMQPALLLVLPFFALALAVPAKRTTSSLGVFLSVIGIVTFNEVSEAAERAGAAGALPVVPAQWIPFALFSLLSLWLFWQLAHRPGPPPLAVIERGLAGFGAWVLRGLSFKRWSRRMRARKAALA